MKIKISQRLLDYFIQALFIFISVFLAFWLNNYQARQNEIIYTKKVNAAIWEEMSGNLRILERNVGYHGSICEKSNDFFSNKIDNLKNFSPSHIPEINKGFEEIILSNGAFSLINDPAVRLAPHTKVRINRVYEQQQLVGKAYEKLFDDFLNSQEQYDKEKVLESYLVYYNLLCKLWSRESTLIANMKDVMKEIER